MNPFHSGSQQPTTTTAIIFGLAFHPDSQERLSRIPPEKRAELDSKIARTLKGYTYQKMRLRSGAHIIVANPSQQSETTTGVILKLDQLLRETAIGYVLDPYELQRAQTLAAKEKAKRQLTES
jgi:hypothetical protein